MTDAELTARLEKLERDNRRLRAFAVAALVLAAALSTIYATAPVPEKITAHEFDVVDGSGKARMKLRTIDGSPHTSLYDAQGKVRAAMGMTSDGSPSIVLLDAQGNLRAAMGVAPDGTPSIGLSDAQGYPRVGMVLTPGGPGIWLSDPQGFSMDLGNTGIIRERTGETQQTSPASITMFGNDEKHRVLWKAP